MQLRFAAFLFLLASIFATSTKIGTATEEARPNILWLSAEDISAHIGCFGDKHAITPHIDQLATEGVRFTKTFTTAGVCAPCRSGIITGMYQSSLGTHHMRCKAKLPDEIKPFPIYLRQAGYYCTNNSKTDYQFSAPKDTWDASSGKAHWRNRDDKTQPFFSVFNFTGCHESGIASESKYQSVTADLADSQRQDPLKLKLPPYYPDTPVVREDWKRNYELITALDAWAGKLIRELKADGLYENTIIFFWSDHGVGLPRAKRWLYESGTHIPLVVRIPEKFRVSGQGQAGSLDDQLVSSIDLAPTVLNLAGIDVPKHVQGRAFLGRNLGRQRDFVYGARDRMDERYDVIRMVRDKQYRYIRNYEPFKPYYQYMNTPEKGATMKELRKVHAAGGLPPAAQLFMADSKPAEELYDVSVDPHEINNLASDPAYAKTLARMRNAHLNWVKQTIDIGLMPESEIELREAQIGPRYNILRQSNGDQLMTRIRDAASLAIGGRKNKTAMRKLLHDDEPCVRYWSLIGLGNLNVAAEPDYTKCLADESPCVRIAAARALLAMNKPEKALSTLEKELASEHQWGRLRAAIVLDEAEEAARPALPALQAALKNQPNKYIVRVANKAVNDLLGTSNRVP